MLNHVLRILCQESVRGILKSLFLFNYVWGGEKVEEPTIMWSVISIAIVAIVVEEGEMMRTQHEWPPSGTEWTSKRGAKYFVTIEE